ncbi:hypothetical protein BH10PAT1_BH10PAT1_4620 [soil metagenome]
MIKNKFLLILFLSSFFLFLSSNQAFAALITINAKGQAISQVLGDSTIEVKKVADNISPTPDSQISLASVDGTVKLNGVDVTNVKDTLVEIEARSNSSELKIGQSNGKFNIEENGVIADTSFPITVDPAKNELTVDTNSGSRLLSVLPYEATLSLTRAKLINKVVNNKITLNESSNGVLQYEINGTRDVNLFNVASIKANVNSIVSASTGEIIKVDEPQWLKFFGFLFS